MVERGPQRTCLVGHTHRILHLPQDLRFAQHHGIETAGDTKSVPRSQPVVQRVSMRSKQCRRNAPRVREPVQRVVDVTVLARTIDLRAVAGGQNCRLGTPRNRVAQSLERGLDLVDRIGKAAA